jgi:hypothetical protein
MILLGKDEWMLGIQENRFHVLVYKFFIIALSNKRFNDKINGNNDNIHTNNNG